MRPAPGAAVFEPRPDPLRATAALLLGHPPGERHQDVLHLWRAVKPALLDRHHAQPPSPNWRMIRSAPSAPCRVIRSSAHTTITPHLPWCASSRARSSVTPRTGRTPPSTVRAGTFAPAQPRMPPSSSASSAAGQPLTSPLPLSGLLGLPPHTGPPVTSAPPVPSPYDMDATTMSSEQHERGIHALSDVPVQAPAPPRPPQPPPHSRTRPRHAHELRPAPALPRPVPVRPRFLLLSVSGPRHALPACSPLSLRITYM